MNQNIGGIIRFQQMYRFMKLEMEALNKNLYLLEIFYI